MLLAEIIKPNKVKEWHERGYLGAAHEISCDDCNFSYSVQDYHTLMDAKKLAYFFFTEPSSMGLFLLCHGCLFKNIKKISGDELVELIIMDGGREYRCKFYPEDGEPDNPLFGESTPEW